MRRIFLLILFCFTGAFAQENRSNVVLLSSSSNDITVSQKGTANQSNASVKESGFNLVSSFQEGFENQFDLFFVLLF